MTAMLRRPRPSATPAPARARRPIQRLPLAGAAAASLSLAVVLADGPNGSRTAPLVLGAVAVAALVAAVLRRAVLGLRTGEGLTLGVGVLALAFAAALWVATSEIGGSQLAFSLWTFTFGAVLAASRLMRIRGRGLRGGTPWQALAGRGGAERERRDALIDLAGALVGGILVLAGLTVGWGWVMDHAVAFASLIVGSSGGFLVMTAGFFLLGALAVVGFCVWLWRTWARPPEGGSDAGAINSVREEPAVAAHLHDSVLQTLALIGRTADDPDRVRQLARQQERSLRAWLAGRDEANADSLAGAVRVAAQEVEDEQPGVRIEVVAVGDAPLDRSADAMVRAAREAIRNAVRHAGSPVRVFVEVEGNVREVFVRDTGAGFDLAQVADERRGVRDAIVGRMEHVGGTAAIDSGPAGTEVALRHVVADGGA